MIFLKAYFSVVLTNSSVFADARQCDWLQSPAIMIISGIAPE